MIEKRIFPLVRRHSREMSIMLLLVISQALISFVNPIMIREMLESISPSKVSTAGIGPYIAVFFCCFLLGYFGTILTNYIYLRFSFRFKVRFTRELYLDLFRMEYKAFQAKEGGYFVGRIKMLADQAFSLAADRIPSIAVSAVTLAAAAGFIASVNPVLFALAVVFLVLAMFTKLSLTIPAWAAPALIAASLSLAAVLWRCLPTLISKEKAVLS